MGTLGGRSRVPAWCSQPEFGPAPMAGSRVWRNVPVDPAADQMSTRKMDVNVAGTAYVETPAEMVIDASITSLGKKSAMASMPELRMSSTSASWNVALFGSRSARYAVTSRLARGAMASTGMGAIYAERPARVAAMLDCGR